MKILRVIASMDPVSGGPCQGIRSSVSHLKKLGIYNEVVCLDDPNSSYLGKDLFTIRALGPGRGPWQYSKKLLPWLKSNLHRFDVVIVHGLWLYHSYATKKGIDYLIKQYSIFRPKGAKPPKVFIMPHGMLDPYFQKAPGRKFKSIRNWVYWKFIEKHIVNNSDGLLFTCDSELQLARKTFQPYHPKKEINIGYGITTPPAFSSAMRFAILKICPQLENRPYILFLSRIHEKKGLDLLIKAYGAISTSKLHQMASPLVPSLDNDMNNSTKNLDDLPHLVIAGPGLETSFGKRIRALASENNIPLGNIHFIGMLTGDAKWGAFYGCEAFILPSHQENFGIAVVEALACGKPVLITNQVNIWQEILDYKCGIVSQDSFEGIQELMRCWMSVKFCEREAMSNRALECYKKRFSAKRTALQFRNALITQ